MGTIAGAAAQSSLTCRAGLHLAAGSSGSSRLSSASENLAAVTANSAAGVSGLLSLRIRRAGRVDSGFLRRRRGRRSGYRVPTALYGDRGSGQGDTKKDEKKFMTRDEEPEQYWMAPDEKEGKNPMSSPLPWIATLFLVSPFSILLVAYLNGWIKFPAR